MRAIGFPTGALALGDFRYGLKILAETNATAVELSALREAELQPLLAALPELDLRKYAHVSLHLPSSIQAGFEAKLLQLIQDIPTEWPLITHPNIINHWGAWKEFQGRVCVENMDKRKEIGQSARHLRQIFDKLPDATFCFDIGHAHQVDPTMGEAVLILEEFQNKLCQLHVSEVNSESRHDPISLEAAMAFEVIAPLIPEDMPAILESRIPSGANPVDQVRSEIGIVNTVLSVSAQLVGD